MAKAKQSRSRAKSTQRKSAKRTNTRRSNAKPKQRRGTRQRQTAFSVQSLTNSAIIRLLGAIMLAFSTAAALSLFSWSFSDPSITQNPSEHINNILGRFGVSVADLLNQFFGLSAMILLVPVAAWGWHLLRKNYPSYPLPRLLLLPLSAAGVTFAFALIPVQFSWPLPHGLGGISGDQLLTRSGTANWHPYVKGALAAITLAFSANVLLVASGIKTRPLWRVVFGDMKTATHYCAQILYLIFEPLIRWTQDSLSSFSWRETRLSRAGWSSIIRRMKEEPEDEWPEYQERAQQSYSEPLDPAPVDPLYEERIEPHFGVHPPHHQSPTHTSGRLDFTPRLDDEADYTDEKTEPAFAQEPRHPKTRKNKKDQKQTRSTPQTQFDFTEQYFELPAVDLLDPVRQRKRKAADTANILHDNARYLEETLKDFGVKGEIVAAHPGPVVTLYELEPARGVKTSRVISLADDIARSMSATSARVAVIPGRNAIGIELPNAEREMVYLRELFETEDFNATNAKLPLALGKDIGGDPVIADLTRMPHLLIAGTTGSGKSVGINTMITSLLYRLTPEECRLILIDPKMLELSVYDDIPHLLTPVVTDPRKAITALKWTIREMEERYKKMSILGVRNISSFNERLTQAEIDDEPLTRKIQTGFDQNSGRPIYQTDELNFKPMPYIVVVIDEMADLMMVAGKEIEAAVQRLAQMARAAGIHLITATQRPSVDVITGTIKANFPTRVSFRVTTKVDSRTILGEQGAEQLLGDGDMLYMSGGAAVTRIHGPFVSDDEIENIVNHLKVQGAPEYLEEVTQETDDGEGADNAKGPVSSGDELYDRAVALVLRDKRPTISYIQRRLSIGYNKAATLIERMEEEGLVSPINAAGKREILVEADAA